MTLKGSFGFFLQFEGMKQTNCRLAGWETGDFKRCAMEKRGLFSKLHRKNIATAGWTAEWEFAVYWLQGSGGKLVRHPPYHPKTSSIGSMMRCARLSDATHPWKNSCMDSS